MCRFAWHVVKDYPGYEINRAGEIRNRETKKVLKPQPDRRGYLRIMINRHHVRVHILVAKQFIPNPNNLAIVDHKKGNKTDNRASQLEWVSQSENIRRAWKLGLIGRRRHAQTSH